MRLAEQDDEYLATALHISSSLFLPLRLDTDSISRATTALLLLYFPSSATEAGKILSNTSSSSCGGLRAMDKGSGAGSKNSGMMSAAKDWFLTSKLTDNGSSNGSSSGSFQSQVRNGYGTAGSGSGALGSGSGWGSSGSGSSGSGYSSGFGSSQTNASGRGDGFRNMNTWMPTSL
jgi:hypothetical protein